MAKMSFTVIPIEVKTLDEYCQDLENMCFWDSVMYQVSENYSRKNHSIGAVGPTFYKFVCPQLQIKYILLNGKSLK